MGRLARRARAVEGKPEIRNAKPETQDAGPEPGPDLCERCGRCCYAKLIIDGEVVYTPFPCPHLDTATRLCTVYERRHEVNPDCIALEEGIRLGVFPGDCPYVRDLPGYVPPRLEMTPEEMGAYADEIEEIGDAVGRPSPPPGRPTGDAL